MELGEPDESGRRRPIPVEGKTETIAIDTMILAIGQAVDASIFECDKTRKNAIAYDKETFMTSMPGVFAGGDCGNDKISIAVEAIADAKKVSESIDAYLDGEIIRYEKPYFVERDDINEKTFEDRERECRPEMPQLSAEERKNNFSEVIPDGYTAEQAEAEASRCLECGCHDYFECKLIDLAHQYDVKPERFAGDKNTIDFEDDHPFIVRDPNKCILCGLCVRVCDEVMGVGALGLVHGKTADRIRMYLLWSVRQRMSYRRSAGTHDDDQGNSGRYSRNRYDLLLLFCRLQPEAGILWRYADQGKSGQAGNCQRRSGLRQG